MKIRRQFSLLIAGIVALPMACMCAITAYTALASPHRATMRRYEEIRRLNELGLKESDWNHIDSYLRRIPPEVQMAVHCGNTVVFSTIPEIETGSQLTRKQLFEFMQSTGSHYDYQMQTLLHQRSGPPEESPPPRKFRKESARGIVITRMKSFDGRRNFRMPRFLAHLTVVLLILEVFAATFSAHISRSISNSIIELQKTARKIADGNLDTKIERPCGARGSNEISELKEDLERMRDSLKDNEQRRAKFIMGISHDLRTPVALIKGYAEAMRDGIVSGRKEAGSSLSIIVDKADQLDDMIGELIGYVKMNNSEWRHSLHEVGAAERLRKTAEDIRIAAQACGRNFSSRIEIAAGTMVRMDEKLFERAMENLCSNALRYTKEGGSIFLGAREEGGAIVVALRDSGMGIPGEEIPEIFDLFYRGTNSRREEGSGIGLSVVKTIIDSHGWQIGVESEVGKGSEFRIRIPI